MAAPTARWPWSLAIAAAGLSLMAGSAGLLVEDVYTGPASTAQMLRAFDLLTVLLVAPTLAGAAARARSGSVSRSLLVVSLLAYLAYTHAYYVFGTGFNDLFLLHVAVFATALAALVTTTAQLDVAAVESTLRPRARPRQVAVILAVLAVGLGCVWVDHAVANAVSGRVPPGSALVETETVVRLGMALDLALLVPLYAAAAALLWRGVGWGYVLACLALVAGVLHQVAYVLAMQFKVMGDVEGAVAYDPVEPVVVSLYVAGLVLLVRPSARG